MTSSEQKVLPYAGVDETLASTVKAALYKILQTPGRLFWAGILAGILIGMGYWFAYETAASFWPYRVFLKDTVVAKEHIGGLIGFEALSEHHIDLVTVAKLILGAVFPLGLIAILIGGAELWTSCPQLTIYPLLCRRVKDTGIIYNWVAAYAGNFVGSLFLAFMATFGTSMLLGHPFFDISYMFAYKKVHLDAWTAFWRGIGCNFLVNLAVWLWLRSKKGDYAGQIMLIWFPIFAFVAIGFEHSIANMFAIPAGIFGSAINWKVYTITYKQYFLNNLLPVTYGNLIGALVFVTLYYWYLAAVGNKIEKAGPSDLIAAALRVGIVLAAIHLAVMVLVPAIIASGVEAALGLHIGTKLSNPYIALVPGIAVVAYYVILPFIAYKTLKPWAAAQEA